MVTGRHLRFVVPVVAGLTVVTQLPGMLRRRKQRRRIAERRKECAAKKEDLEKRLRASGDGELLNEDRLLILSLDITRLLEQLKTGTLQPAAVLAAYQAKALLVDKETNAVCDFLLEAEEWAKRLEEVPEEHRGPLHGLPVSIKECFLVENHPSTVGLSSLLDHPATRDACFVRALKDLGAVPFCLTNVSQTLISTACSNPVYGRTVNPRNETRTCGGSSGGEGALIGAGGSLLGLGTDLGGSLRIPAHFCGVAALKPTPGRLYMEGMRTSVGVGNTMLGTIDSVNGFLASSVAGLEVGMRSMLGRVEQMSKEDWMVVPVPWRNQEAGAKLRVGWMDEDGLVEATPGCRRAVREVVEMLEAQGHEVVEWKVPEVQKMMETFFSVLQIPNLVGQDLQDSSLWLQNTLLMLPSTLRTLLAPLVHYFSPLAGALWGPHSTKVEDVWTQAATRNQLQYNFSRAWEQLGLDVLICPAFVFPAPPNGVQEQLLLAMGTSYTSIYNLLGCPAGVVPVTRETVEDQQQLEDNYAVKSDVVLGMVRQATRGAVGMPIGVQVVGRHFQEEKVLAVMKQIELLVNVS